MKKIKAICLLIITIISLQFLCSCNTNNLKNNIIIGDYEYYMFNENASIIKYNGNDDNIVIPSIIEVNGTTYDVTEIKQYAFSKCSSLISIIIPNGVTTIEDGAFYDCSSLTNVIIPNSVTKIGSYLFYGCDSLQYNEYDNGLYLGNNENPYLVLVKAKETSITSCIINENTRFIYSYAFSNCKFLTSISIPNGVTSIGYEAFNNCSILKSITIPSSITSIGEDLFLECTSLQYNKYDNGLYLGNEDNPYLIFVRVKDTSITSCIINDNTNVIASYAFSNCTFLKSIIIPRSVKTIGYGSFFMCSYLTSIIIPGSVTSIGNYAFYECKFLKIYCEASSKPDGWDSDWNYSKCRVVWGYKG